MKTLTYTTADIDQMTYSELIAVRKEMYEQPKDADWHWYVLVQIKDMEREHRTTWNEFPHPLAQSLGFIETDSSIEMVDEATGMRLMVNKPSKRYGEDYPALINWSALGDQDAEHARVYAGMIDLAVQIAEWYNNGGNEPR